MDAGSSSIAMGSPEVPPLPAIPAEYEVRVSRAALTIAAGRTVVCPYQLGAM